MYQKTLTVRFADKIMCTYHALEVWSKTKCGNWHTGKVLHRIMAVFAESLKAGKEAPTLYELIIAVAKSTIAAVGYTQSRDFIENQLQSPHLPFDPAQTGSLFYTNLILRAAKATIRSSRTPCFQREILVVP